MLQPRRWASTRSPCLRVGLRRGSDDKNSQLRVGGSIEICDETQVAECGSPSIPHACSFPTSHPRRSPGSEGRGSTGISNGEPVSIPVPIRVKPRNPIAFLHASHHHNPKHIQ